jgi:ankyrin repeat protein
VAFLFYSNSGYFICRELNRVLNKNHDVKNRVLSALLSAHLQSNSTTNKVCKHFIKNNIITNCLLRYLIVNKIDISYYLVNISKSGLFSFITSLDYKTIEDFLFSNEILNQVALNKIKSILYYLFVCKKWQLITSLLNSKLKFDFINHLTKKQIHKVLVIILNNKQYDIADHFLLNYVQLKATDSQKNNILHHLILGDKLLLLESMAKNIRSDIMHKLLLHKNNIGLTPLMIAMTSAKNIDYFNLILSYCDDDILNVTNSINNNVIMLAAQEGHQQCLQKLIAKISNSKLLTKSNIYGYNSLMLAIKNKHDACANFILDNIPLISLKQAETGQGLTAIHLAILHKSKLIEKLINTADKSILKILSYSNSSILATATQEGDEQAIKIILQSREKLLHEKNVDGLNPLMLTAKNDNLACLKILFEYADHSLLLKTNNKGNNILMIAIQNASLEIVNFLLHNCKQSTLKKLYKQTNDFYSDALCMALYCKTKPICFTGSYEELKKRQGEILSVLIEYTPY